MTSPKSWQILSLFTSLIILLFFSAGGGGSSVDPNQAKGVLGILTTCLIWLLVGALLRLVFSKGQQEKISETLLGIFLGWGILWLAWYFPIWFPTLKLNSYGFQFNLQESPVVFWMAVAFILGFYRRMTLKIPAAVWNQIKNSLGIKEDPDLKGNAEHRFLSYWNGFKSILADILHLPSDS